MVVGALTVKDADEIMLITVAGQMVRTRVSDIREAGRNTQGVKLIDLDGHGQTQSHRPRHQRRKRKTKSRPPPCRQRKNVPGNDHLRRIL